MPEGPPRRRAGPSHEVYRRSRMEAFRQLLRDFEVDGVWLDYHHAHASWEQATPSLPDTWFCLRRLLRFQNDTARTLHRLAEMGVSSRP